MSLRKILENLAVGFNMQIKFINLNLWESGKLKDNTLNFLKRERPDILSLQEVWQCSKILEHIEIENLKKLLNLPHSVFSSTFSTIKNWEKIVWGNAILSRFPIKNHHTTFFVGSYLDNYVPKVKGDFSDLPRSFVSAEISINNTRLNVVNIHGVWGFNGEDNPNRLKMSMAVINEIKGKTNVILSGDFNTRPYTKSIKNIEKYLTNVFKDELITSFNIKRKNHPGDYSTAVVDMVFASPNIKAISHICPNVDISDHLPQICVFEI